MEEAIESLKKMRDKIRGQKWADEEGKRKVLLGIRLSIARLESELET